MQKLFLTLLISLFFILPSFCNEETFLEESLKFSDEFEEIYLENPMSFKYETGLKEIKKISGREEVSKTAEKDPNTIYRKNNLSVESVYKKSKSSYLTNSVENEQALKYKTGNLTFKAGISNSYEYADLNKNSKKLFFSPEWYLNKHFTLGLFNSMNPDDKVFEQGMNIKYTPYFLKNSSFGLAGKIKERVDSKNSLKLELNSEFYLW